MKSDIEIKDIIFEIIDGSELHNAITGALYKDQRPLNSDKEDIVISVLDGLNGEIQTAILNVNIYVADIARGSDMVENAARIRTLSRFAYEILEEHVADNYQLAIEKQQCLKVEKIDQHCINNTILLKITNFKNYE